MNPVYLNNLGIVCALGAGKQTVADGLFAGDSGVLSVENATSDGTTLPFAPVRATLPAMPETLAPYASRNVALALLALEEIDEAIRSALERFGAARVAVVMGSSTSGIQEGEDAVAALLRDGALPPGYDFRAQEIGSVAESIAVHYGLQSPAITISTACSSSAKALVTGRRLLNQNLADAVIAGGCDSRCGLTLNGFHALSALSQSACQPFSANRDGTVIGEGAAIFLMTREESPVALLGAGESADAHNMTAPEPEGRGAAAAMEAAIADAELSPADIDYVNLHGTATVLNDAMESRALRAICGVGVRCSSSKPQVGHTLGAAGALEAGLCWLTLAHNPDSLLPPHLWDAVPDPDAELTGLARPGDQLNPGGPVRLMSNSYAFGGSNISLILGDTS